MSDFENRSWEERRKQLGKEAEAAFTRFATAKGFQFDRYGFDDSTITTKFGMLPDIIRYTPDFACVRKFPFLVECKGMGSKGYVQIKDMILPAMKMWQQYIPVYFFIWDSSQRRASFMSLNELLALIEQGLYTENTFHDGPVTKKVYQIHSKDLMWMKGEKTSE